MTGKGIAIASGGGHWMQMLRLRPAFGDAEVLYVTTLDGLATQAGLVRSALVPECNRNTPLRILACAWALWRILRRERPDWVISTGALPGYIALRLARRMGVRTVWVDSVANAEEMSMAGRKVRPYADLWLSQWEHVAATEGAEFAGAVL